MKKIISYMAIFIIGAPVIILFIDAVKSKDYINLIMLISVYFFLIEILFGIVEKIKKKWKEK